MTFPGAKNNLRVFLRVFFRVLCLVCCLGLSSLSLLAQDEAPRRRGSRIIDDTTKQVYGPRTSHYYYEKDVFYNRDTYYLIDTLIRNFHRYNYVQRFDYLYQDLGNMGTAIRPIYYQSPELIGHTPGFNAYDLYWDTEEVKYYDTKSPFTNLKVDLGGRGRSRTRVAFSRNINPRWNFGFNYRGLFVDKQIQRSGKGDRHDKGVYYDIYSAYQSKDSTYRLFFNFRRMNHQVDEYGGVYTSGTPSLSDFFGDNVEPWLREAESNDMRANLHLMQQYRVGSALQLYHQIDVYRQTNKFLDNPTAERTGYFDYNEYVPADSVKEPNIDISRFRSMRNEVGIKGSLLKLFYNGYYAIRQYDMINNHVWTDTVHVRTHGTESYIGGRASLKLDSLVEVNGWLEIQQEGNLRLEGEIKSKWFEASLKQKIYEPTYAQQFYRGAHDAWDNNFSKVESTWLNGYVHYNSRWLSLSPGISFTRMSNYVYFRKDSEAGEGQQSVLPVQSSGSQAYISPEMKLSITMLRHVHFDARGIYTQFITNDDNALRIPDLFVNAQLSYANIFYHGNLDMHAGVDVHWQSAYFAMGYDPAIQQFYTQNDLQVPAYPIIDVFFNAKIKRGRIFLKYHNLNQLITKQGYLPTPYYPGVKNIVDFGFDWSFYD